MDNHEQELAFPSVEDIKKTVAGWIISRCNGIYPVDDWFDLGRYWTVNVWSKWEPAGQVQDQHITIYPLEMQEDGEIYCDTTRGIVIL